MWLIYRLLIYLFRSLKKNIYIFKTNREKHSVTSLKECLLKHWHRDLLKVSGLILCFRAGRLTDISSPKPQDFEDTLLHSRQRPFPSRIIFFRVWPNDFVMMFMKIYDIPISSLASFRCCSASEGVNQPTAFDKSTPARLLPSGMFSYAAHYNQWKQHHLTFSNLPFSTIFWALNLFGLHIEQFNSLETVR